MILLPTFKPECVFGKFHLTHGLEAFSIIILQSRFYSRMPSTIDRFLRYNSEDVYKGRRHVVACRASYAGMCSFQ